MAKTRTTEGVFVSFEAGDGAPKGLVGAGRLWNFQLNRADLRSEHIPVLRACASFLKEHPDFYCRIIGTASRSGSNSFNLQLSRDRADNVLGWLAVHGDITVAQMTHQNGSARLGVGEEVWASLGLEDVKAGDRSKERDRHRTVVLEIWDNHNPTMEQQIAVLRRILRNDAHF
jgi:hypothetical protein